MISSLPVSSARVAGSSHNCRKQRQMDTKVVERSLESGLFNIIWEYKSIFPVLAVFVSVAEGERRCHEETRKTELRAGF